MVRPRSGRGDNHRGRRPRGEVEAVQLLPLSPWLGHPPLPPRFLPALPAAAFAGTTVLPPTLAAPAAVMTPVGYVGYVGYVGSVGSVGSVGYVGYVGHVGSAGPVVTETAPVEAHPDRVVGSVAGSVGSVGSDGSDGSVVGSAMCTMACCGPYCRPCSCNCCCCNCPYCGTGVAYWIGIAGRAVEVGHPVRAE